MQLKIIEEEKTVRISDTRDALPAADVIILDDGELPNEPGFYLHAADEMFGKIYFRK